MNKGTTVEQGEKAIKCAKEVCLFVDTFVIFGYPGGTPDIVKQTIDFIKRTKPDAVYPFVANLTQALNFDSKLRAGDGKCPQTGVCMIQ